VQEAEGQDVLVLEVTEASAWNCAER